MVFGRLLRVVAFALGFIAAPASGQRAPLASPQSPAAAVAPLLRASRRHFTDASGRVVVLRGVNVSGRAKVPPFLPVSDLSALDRLTPLGFNVVRLVFIWEAYEPSPGVYDEAYLGRVRQTAAAAWARGMFVIVDFHQDGFSRNLSRGSGDGFPLWAVSPRARRSAPDNGPGCKAWALYMATDPNMHRSFTDFYADVAGVRTRYLLMVRRVAGAFAGTAGVIGYCPINEPWGDERREIAPLYRDAAAAVRAAHPAAILFLEGHVTTNCGFQSKLEPPGIDNVAYAPHYYQPATIYRNAWGGKTSTIDRAFAHMTAKAAEWDAPLFVGDFGAPAETGRAGEYVSALYDRLDDALVSGAQWNYTPDWNDRDKDGWNGEDFNVLSPDGAPRPNFVPRPYPRAVAGTPLRFQFQRSTAPRLEFTWEHRPELGATEIQVPAGLFAPASMLTVEGPGAVCQWDGSGERLVCRSPAAGTIRVRLTAP